MNAAVDGLSFRARATQLAHTWKAVTQQHHRELIPRLKPLIPDDGVIVDVGAHAGQFTKLFAGMAPRGRVVALEPSAYARSILAQVVAVHGLKRATIVAAGLSDAPGELTLSTPVKGHGGLRFGLAHFGAPQAGEATQTTPIKTLDALVDELGLTRLDFIKADIEGWEIRMLRGARHAIQRFKPAIALELDDPLCARADTRAQEAWDMLAPLGYRGESLHGAASAPAYAGPSDYLFIPRRD
ncbi:MAG: FkbM family methyltransferase [Hyphomonadaceae bacterium]|nr:FkbM family methyltransferase [Hyphomonadaceae bacterium]